MKVKIRDKESGFRISLRLPTRFALWVARKALMEGYPWVIPLLKESKGMRKFMHGRPLLEIDADDAYVKITL